MGQRLSAYLGEIFVFSPLNRFGSPVAAEDGYEYRCRVLVGLLSGRFWANRISQDPNFCRCFDGFFMYELFCGFMLPSVSRDQGSVVSIYWPSNKLLLRTSLLGQDTTALLGVSY